MSTYTLKSIARRGSLLGVAAALFVATVIPSMAFADALNPLTERSLLLTSSAPGYQDSDGSGASTAEPNAIGETYAPAGSGPNGQKTGETFTFRVSTDSTSRAIEAFTFQYCTTAAGLCQGPGNNTGDARDTSRGSDSKENETSDLNVNYTGPVAGTDFEVWVDGVDESTNWEMTTDNVEDDAHPGDLTGAQNFIRLTNSTSPATPVNGDQIQIVFNATETNYITNPGDGAFFVKINTYDTDDELLHVDTVPQESNPNIIDGGVTVANVMTDSIHIITKVLETMAFSVGTRNRDTVQVAESGQPGYEGDTAVHGTCDPIQQVDGNRLNLGNPAAEYSLETTTTWDVYSYWRLSSNSSGGATVYYSGNTLANTVGDEISEIGATAASSTQGTEQFGLAFVDATVDDTGEFDPAFDDLVTAEPDRFKYPTLELDTGVFLQPEAEYANGTGDINGSSSAAFAFVKSSNTVPAVIAQNNTMVISCATAKMRYIANIGADTPAGVYTTKINYLAAPQY